MGIGLIRRYRKAVSKPVPRKLTIEEEKYVQAKVKEALEKKEVESIVKTADKKLAKRL